MKHLNKIFVSLTIAFFAVCCGAVLLFNWHALGWKALSVPTGSMRPTIPPGSLVLVHSVPDSSLRIGDVITYANLRKPGTTITHRIIKAYKLDGKVPAYITKGDANTSADPFTVVGGQVQGKAVWHVPYLGRAMQWSKTWAGIVILVYVPAFFIMFGAAQDMAEYLKKFQVYQLVENRPRARRFFGRKTAGATMSLLIFMLIFGVIAGPVQALLRSNTVTLANNRLTVASQPNQCTSNGTNVTVTGSGSGTNNVNVSSTTTQTGASGNASSSGGSATSGNVTNTSCSNVTVTVTNH